MAKRTFRAIPRTWNGIEEMTRRIVDKLLEIQKGKTNNTFEVTLRVAPNTTTVLQSDLITPDSEITLAAKTANAAAALATTHYAVAAGAITITHTSSASADRTFGVSIVG